MTIKKLKNGDVMVIIPARQKNRWRAILYCAIEWIDSLPMPHCYQEKHALEDARKVRNSL